MCGSIIAAAKLYRVFAGGVRTVEDVISQVVLVAPVHSSLNDRRQNGPTWEKDDDFLLENTSWTSEE